MYPSLIEIGSKTAEKKSAQTNRQTDKQTDRHYENNGHLAVNQNVTFPSAFQLFHTYVTNVVSNVNVAQSRKFFVIIVCYCIK